MKRFHICQKDDLGSILLKYSSLYPPLRVDCFCHLVKQTFNWYAITMLIDTNQNPIHKLSYTLQIYVLVQVYFKRHLSIQQ